MVHAVTIHHAPGGLLGAGGGLGGDLAALRLASRVALVRDMSAAAPRPLRGQGLRLTLNLHNRVCGPHAHRVRRGNPEHAFAAGSGTSAARVRRA